MQVTTMIQTELDPQVETTRDLLRSMQQSILRLRQEVEQLRLRLAEEQGETLTGPLPQITKIEGLIRDCQKVEKFLVEQNKLSDANTGLDLDAARAEICSRLDRLRAAQRGGDPAGGDE